jgi:hypothetical protein
MPTSTSAKALSTRLGQDLAGWLLSPRLSPKESIIAASKVQIPAESTGLQQELLSLFEHGSIQGGARPLYEKEKLRELCI